MASRSPGNKNNLIYIKFRRFNNGLLSSSDLHQSKHKNVLKDVQKPNEILS
jgi:hypothetical protein